MKREELLRSAEYWTTKVQFDLYACAEDFMRLRGMNRKQLSEYLGVSKGYVSQMLNGDYDHKLSKLVELSLAFGMAPVVEFKPIEEVINEDRQQYSSPRWRPASYNIEMKSSSVSFGESSRYEKTQSTTDTLVA